MNTLFVNHGSLAIGRFQCNYQIHPNIELYKKKKQYNFSLGIVAILINRIQRCHNHESQAKLNCLFNRLVIASFSQQSSQ